MLEFEHDYRTRGEQLVLRAFLRGEILLGEHVWDRLHPEDMSHDLHGRIWRHILRLVAEHERPSIAAVCSAIRAEHRAPVCDGVPQYLLWLASDSPYFRVASVDALLALLSAMDELQAVRNAAAWARK